MVVEEDVGVVEFVCPGCRYRWRRSYALVHCEYLSGEVRDYFSLAGERVASPYSPDGAPTCPKCAERAVGRPAPRFPVARRGEALRRRGRTV